jgi:hypothetical protein
VLAVLPAVPRETAVVRNLNPRMQVVLKAGRVPVLLLTVRVQQAVVHSPLLLGKTVPAGTASRPRRRRLRPGTGRFVRVPRDRREFDVERVETVILGVGRLGGCC